MARWGLAILVAAAVAGCASAGAYGYKSRYHGVHVDHFFLEWGAPISSRGLKDGGTIYLWYGNRDSAYIPGHTDSELIGNTAWWRGYRLRNFTPRWECGVRIVANPDGTIRDILLHESSGMWWNRPRCRDVFGAPIPWSE